MSGILTLNLAQMKHASAVDMPSPSWRTRTGMPTSGGQLAVVAGDDGSIYAMGGYAGGERFTRVEAYNILMDKWTIKSPMPQATRGAASTKGSDGLIYVISGTDSGYVSTVQAYNSSSDLWSLKAEIPTPAWMASAATGDDGKIYVFGGETTVAPYSNKTQIYNPSTDSWTEGSGMPTARSELRVVKGPDGLIYAMGGYNGSALSVVEAYNPATDTWTKKAPMPSRKLQFGLVLGPDGKMYVMGGGTSYSNNNSPFFDTVEIYDPEEDSWTNPIWSESIMPTARKEFKAVLGHNDKIYAIGGANGEYIGTNEEASIALPENVPPTAYINSIVPNPSTEGEPVSFVGHGSDVDGSVVAYKWRSSINGTVGVRKSFDTSTLSVGTHTVYFTVKDNDHTWSDEVMTVVTVNVNYTEDPTYQKTVEANEAIDDLQQENSQLTNRLNGLDAQIANLFNTIDDLNGKLDTMTLQLLAAGIITLILVAVTIVVVFTTRSKRAPSTQTTL